MRQRQRDGSPLNIAATWVGTHALGPGRRSVAWVQGCPFRCAGCVAPDWIPDRPATAVWPDELAEQLLADPEVTGLTFSGGEPMMQAAGLAAAARAARRARSVSLICFTGFRLERLRADPPAPGVADLLAEVDVLIDGRYVAAGNDGRGLRGSANQRVLHLTDRLRAWDTDLVSGPRTVEVAVSGPAALLIGVPPRGFVEVFDTAVDRLAAQGVGPDTENRPAGQGRRPDTENRPAGQGRRPDAEHRLVGQRVQPDAEHRLVGQRVQPGAEQQLSVEV